MLHARNAFTAATRHIISVRVAFATSFVMRVHFLDRQKNLPRKAVVTQTDCVHTETLVEACALPVCIVRNVQL